MAGKLKFLMVIHSHQPVGNFGHIFEEAFLKAYLPFIETLERHPGIKISLHYSGSLLDWLEIHRPEFISRIRRMVSKGQVELFSGGYYEPILALLPEEDEVGQIKMLNAKIRSLWGRKPQGAWLTERIWEPGLAKIFNRAEIKYTVIDDTHFEKIGKKPEDVYGYYLTEDEGLPLNIFPGSKVLRYAMPFKIPDETVKYLNEFLNCGKDTIVFADDGEKFGFWPHTYKWVYEEKWLENFFREIENNSRWIETLTFEEYQERYPPRGMIYLPCASYSEMLDWSGGYFKNFLVKYPEANNMHKRMLQVSKRLRDAKHFSAGSSGKAENSKFKEAECHLYMAQSNDSYWHGVFGGLYLNHLRCNVYSNLIKADEAINAAADLKKNRMEATELDFDYDGKKELIMENSRIRLYIDPDEEAALFELDYKGRCINLINTLSRRKEEYHKKLKEKVLNKSCAGQGLRSIHNMEKTIPEELSKYLVYDRSRKSCLQEHFFKRENVSLAEFLDSEAEELKRSDISYRLDSILKNKNNLTARFKSRFNLNGNLPFEIEKFIAIGPDSAKLNFKYIISNNSEESWNGKFGVEFNFSLWDGNLAVSGQKDSVMKMSLNDSWFGLGVKFELSRLTEVWHFPIETVYESEKGFEKNFQGLSILFSWNFSLSEKESCCISISQDIKG